MLFRVIFGYLTLKRGVSNTPRVKRLDFDDFVCIFAADFENLYPRIRKIFGIFWHFWALNRIEILDVRIHFVETIENLFMNRL